MITTTKKKDGLVHPSQNNDSAYADEADELGGLADGGIGLTPSGVGLIQLVDPHGGPGSFFTLCCLKVFPYFL